MLNIPAEQTSVSRAARVDGWCQTGTGKLANVGQSLFQSGQNYSSLFAAILQTRHLLSVTVIFFYWKKDYLSPDTIYERLSL